MNTEDKQKREALRKKNLRKLGEKLRSVRQSKGAGRTEIAKAIGVHTSTYCRYEDGELEMGILTYLMLWDVLGDKNNSNMWKLVEDINLKE